MKNRDILIFWFDAPPKVSKGAFNYVSKNWGEQVIFVCNQDFDEYRKETNWNDGDFGDAQVVHLSEYDNSDIVIAGIFKQYPNAIHILSGFTNTIQRRVRKHVFKRNVKLGVFSERPVLMGNYIEKLARMLYFQFKYRRIRGLFEPYLSFFLPLGQCGVNTYASFGWKKDIMYPFMYNPQIVYKKTNFKIAIDDKIKFLYVGRFYYKTKGIDTLVRATKYLRGNWSLDLVGGYGKDAEEVITWVETQENVNYIGSWPSEEVSERMKQYDVVVVPSKYDGWNLLPNEALHAGVATIVTDEAVSDELIRVSEAGAVVPSDNPRELAKAMQIAIDDKLQLNNWKNKAQIYVHRISSETVGNYLIDILDYTFYKKDKMPKPQCPWL